MSCQTSATETLFTTITGSTVITSSSSSVTTLPGSTSTILSTSCLLTATSTGNSTTIAAADGVCASSTIITSTTVIDGGVSTIQVPFEVTSVFTSTQATRTLFSECTTTEAHDQDTSTTTTSTSTTSPPTTTTTSPTSTTSSTTSTTDAETTIFSDQTFTTLSTPTTTLTTSQDSTLADGQITQILVTVTSVLDPTSVVQTSQVAIQTNTSGGDSSSSSNVGAIAGGVVGGFVGLLALVGAVWYFCRRRRNWDDIFEKDYEEYMKPQPVQRGHMLDMEDEPIRAAAVNDEPKPYVYGLVGSANTPAPNTLGVGLAAVSPSAPQNRLSTGSGSINANSINTLSQQQHYHNRTPSETPLMMGGMMSNRSGPNTPGSRSSIGPGLSPSPSLAPSVNGARTGSPSPGPGPLGVLINTGPSLSMAESGFGLGSGFEHEHEKEHGNGNGNDSPTSVAPPRGALFITNQTEESNVTPPGSPVPRSKSPGSPGSPGVGRSSLSMVINGSEFASVAASPTVSSAASAIPARVRDEDGLQHNASVSSQSVYSQASGSTVQQMPVGLREAIRQSQTQSQGRTGSGTGVFVHTDGGRVDLSGEPPSYKNS